MGRRGPLPLPTQIRLAKGERRPSRINTEEPRLPTPAILAPPRDLVGAGRREWQRLAGTLVAAGVLTEADRSAFEDYCRGLSDLRRYEAKARRAGLELAIAKGYQNQVLRLRAQVTTLRAHLGLTPSSRTTVRAKLAATPSDADHARFFGSQRRA